MEDARPPKRALARSALDAHDTAPTAFQAYGAVATAVGLIVIALLVALLGRAPGPQVHSLVPLAGGVWSFADLLTAFLLLAQFYINGRRFFGVLSMAYAFTGFLTWPYLAAFPGVFGIGALTVGDEQTSIYLWSIWHCAFSVLVICATLNDPALGRIVSRQGIRSATGLCAVAPLIAAAVVATLVYSRRDLLPHLVVGGHFQPLFRTIFVPLVIVLNALACIVLLRPKRLTPLKICLALAVLSAAIDASLNVCSNAYSYAWDVGKIITVFTAGVVLFMIMCDIAGLYGRLARIANVDVLTSLQNRRAFDEYFTLACYNAGRLRGSIGLLVIDIDHFKRYNDVYGHLGGDECLRRVACAINTCVTRPLDFVARYGGEEFVVILPDTPPGGMFTLAERIRTDVAQLQIVHDGKPLGRVAVSVGIGFALDAGLVDPIMLFESADRALYEAKSSGRNQVVVGDVEVLVVPSATTLGIRVV